MKVIAVLIFLFCAEVAHAEIVPNPLGCPSRSFCGCGAAKFLGLVDRSLWLAREWLRFPSAEPAPGMVAVWQHHVAVILEYLGGGKAKMYDANSGKHLTRVHIRSIAGASIRNPSGTLSKVEIKEARVHHAERHAKRRHRTYRRLASVSAPSAPSLHRPL